MPMKNPPHPGRIVRQDCIDALELTVTRTAELLRVTRQALSNVVNEKAGISARNGHPPGEARMVHGRPLDEVAGGLRSRPSTLYPGPDQG